MSNTWEKIALANPVDETARRVVRQSQDIEEPAQTPETRREDLEAERNTLLAEIQTINQQILEAKAYYQKHRRSQEGRDMDWYSKAHSAKKHKVIRLDEVIAQLRVLKRKGLPATPSTNKLIRKEAQRDRHIRIQEAFVDLTKGVLTAQQFESLMQQAIETVDQQEDTP